MSNFEDSINQIAALYLDNTIQNAEIVKSHSLEILLSFSESDDFLKIMAQNPDFVGAIVNSISDPALMHKVLVLLMNLSANVKLSQLLAEKHLVNRLFEIITDTMKEVTPQHLAIEKQFFSHEGSSDPEIKVLNVSKDKISSKDLPYMLVIEKIKQSIFILINLTKHAEKAREDVMQYSTTLECSNVLNVIDWLLNPQLKPLFLDFIDVLMNLSTDSKLRAIMIEHCTKKIFELFNMEIFCGELEFIIKIYGVIRNLSFEPKNTNLLEAIANDVFIQQNLAMLQSSSIEGKNKESLAISFVDTYLALLTSETFMSGETIQPEKIFTENFSKAVELAHGCSTEKDSELDERSEALIHIVQTHASPTPN